MLGLLCAFLGASVGCLVMGVIWSGLKRRARVPVCQVPKTEVLLPFELERGLVAYEAYRRGCAGIAPETRAPLPDWAELHPEIQTVWVDVANEVCRRYGAIY